MNKRLIRAESEQEEPNDWDQNPPTNPHTFILTPTRQTSALHGVKTQTISKFGYLKVGPALLFFSTSRRTL